MIIDAPRYATKNDTAYERIEGPVFQCLDERTTMHIHQTDSFWQTREY
jgi:hypothetical protein